MIHSFSSYKPVVGNPPEQQHEHVGHTRHSSNQSRSYPNYHQRQEQHQFHKNGNNGDKTKTGPRNRRYNRNRNHNYSFNDLSDASVSTTSSEGSTNNRNWIHQHYHTNMSFHNSWTNSSTKKNNGSRKKAPKNSEQNSMALNSYLRERGWSLPDDLGPNYTYNNNHATSTIVLRQSELVRRHALMLVESTLCRWASSIEKNPNPWQRVRVSLVTFGSYRLHAYRRDADVDLLALCPPFCTRKDFFTSLVEMMKGEAAISHIHPIASAFTPVIKFKIHNIHFDMLFGRASGKANIEKLINFQRLSLCPLTFADTNIGEKSEAIRIVAHAETTERQGTQVNFKQVEGMTANVLREFTIEDSFLTGMEDESEVRSANGVRVTQFLINYVPDPVRFRVVLCAVKEWAILNGIYSNVLGFFGGVNWAIMVAYICKRYPKRQPSTLLRFFFKIFATWSWPHPVLLNITDETATEIAIEGMKPWDPKTNPRDARHLMPIVTPVFPRMNSTYNVGIPQKRRILEELVHAAFITEDESNWRKLYNQSNFFQRYANFLKITIRAGTNPGDFTKWLRLCESRLRLLVNALDCPEMSVYPFAQLMEQTYKPTGSTVDRPEALFFIGLSFAPNVAVIDLKHRTSEFLVHQINSWEGRKPGMDFIIHHVVQKDLPLQLISKYVVTKPSAYEIPTPRVIDPTAHGSKIQQRNLPSSARTPTATRSTNTKKTDISKDIRGPSVGDNVSVARSTYSSIARSMNSSIRSVDGTETSLDGSEPESRSQSPLGNLITVEGGPPTLPAEERSKKEETRQGNPKECHDDVTCHSRQSQLYEYLTGKIDDLSSVNNGDDSCCRSQSDQSSTRSPMKKRLRAGSRG